MPENPFKGLWNLPNTLSLIRVFCIPLILWLLNDPSPGDLFVAALVLAVAFFTDLLDGFFARRNREVTSLGKLLDPLADKLLICASLIMLIPLGFIPPWLVFLLVGREMAVTGLRGMASAKGEIIAASFFGKSKTALQMAAILFFLVPSPFIFLSFQTVGTVLIWLALIVSWFSGVAYFYRFYRGE